MGGVITGLLKEGYEANLECIRLDPAYQPAGGCFIKSFRHAQVHLPLLLFGFGGRYDCAEAAGRIRSIEFLLLEPVLTGVDGLVFCRVS